MMKSFKNFWEGKVSFVQSFWFYYFIGGTVISFPLYKEPGLFVNFYLIFFLCAIIFLCVVTWKSAENYKKVKKKKKQGSGWATAGQIYISLATIYLIAGMFLIITQTTNVKLDKEVQGVVNGILTDQSFTNNGWTKKNTICWVKETKKLINDDEWEIMRITYDPNFKGDFEIAKMLAILPSMYTAAGTCGVKLPA